MRATTDAMEALANAGLLLDLDDASRETICKALRLRTCRFLDGERICSHGEEADHLWILTSGTVVVSAEAEGRANTLATRTAPCVIGEISFLRDERRRTATMTACGQVVGFAIHTAAIDSLADGAARYVFMKNLARLVADKLAETVTRRAEVQADGIATERLLRRFVNPYGLAATRTALKTEYQEENVVVLFSDVVGFSAIANGCSPEATAAFVKQVLSAQSHVIEREAGEIDKFMGDAVMAYWIIPGTRPEHFARTAARAVQAARDALAAAAEIRSPLDGAPARLRIGLHLGRAHSGDYGSESRSAFTLIGKDVNLGARLEQAREGSKGEALGPIRISEALYGHLPEDEQERFGATATIQVKETVVAIHSNPNAAAPAIMTPAAE